MNAISTNLIVLRKTAYKESGLIVSSLSPDMGRLDFVIHGARKLGKKNFPEIDLFREVRVEFQDRGGELHYPMNVESLRDHDAISRYPKLFLAMKGLGEFIIQNTHSHVECPQLYQALRNALTRYAENDVSAPWVSLTKLVYLDENGLSPDQLTISHDTDQEEKRRHSLQLFLATALGDLQPPELPRAFWKSLVKWINSLCHYHNLRG